MAAMALDPEQCLPAEACDSAGREGTHAPEERSVLIEQAIVSFLRKTLVLVAVSFAAGCADRPEFGALLAVEPSIASATTEGMGRIHTLLVAATRARADRPGTLLGAARVLTLPTKVIGAPIKVLAGQQAT